MILAVETSTRAFSVFIKDGKMEANLEILFSLTHSQGIVQTVDFMIKRAGKSIKDIEAIYAGLGPGSFTGIRVGLSFANTLSQVLNVPLAGTTSLDILSFEVDRWNSSVVPFIKSRKEEVYASFYKNGVRFDEIKVLKADDFIDYIYDVNPDYLISSNEDFMEVLKPIIENNKINNSKIDRIKSIKKNFSYPKAKFIPTVVEREEIPLMREYLKPVYIRTF